MNITLATRLIRMGLILTCIFFVSCQVKQESGNTVNVLSESNLSALLIPVKSWENYSSQGYSSNDWIHLIAAAKTIQKCEPKLVETVLHKYQLAGHFEKDFNKISIPDTDTKLFLLMRVVFQLPTSVEEANFIMAGGYVSSSEAYINKDHTLNQSWPIKWVDNRPSITARYEGMQGIDARYNAGREYVSFLKLYPMRDLSSYGDAVAPANK